MNLAPPSMRFNENEIYAATTVEAIVAILRRESPGTYGTPLSDAAYAFTVEWMRTVPPSDPKDAVIEALTVAYGYMLAPQGSRSLLRERPYPPTRHRTPPKRVRKAAGHA